MAQAIPLIQVTRGVAASPSSTQHLIQANLSLPGHGDIKNNLTSWISDQPFSDYVTGCINDDLMADPYIDSNLAPLTSVAGWDDPQAKATSIVDSFENLPNTYLMSIPAPRGMEDFLQAIDGQMRLAHQARVVLAGKDFPKDHPVTSENEIRDRNIWNTGLLNLTSPPDNNYKWNGAYLQIVKRGYIGRFVETSSSHEAIGDFKALWGAQLALGIANRRSAWSPYPIKKHLIVHQFSQGSSKLKMRLELDTPTSALVDQLEFNDWVPGDHSQNQKSKIYKLYLKEIDLIFGESDEASRLRLASRWLFDSYATDNELLSYVQAMVCLEIIIGDASLIGEIGLGELLRNRCAYLIGKTSAQRAEILHDFKEIYDVRSHIVHRGKSRMSVRERQLYAKLIWYCKRCIKEEINLLKRTKEDASEAERI